MDLEGALQFCRRCPTAVIATVWPTAHGHTEAVRRWLKENNAPSLFEAHVHLRPSAAVPAIMALYHGYVCYHGPLSIGALCGTWKWASMRGRKTMLAAALLSHRPRKCISKQHSQARSTNAHRHAGRAREHRRAEVKAVLSMAERVAGDVQLLVRTLVRLSGGSGGVR